MKRLITFITAMILVFSMAGCQNKKVKEVEDSIAALGEITLESKDQLQATWDLYKGLSDNEKESLSNKTALEDAVKSYGQQLIKKHMSTIVDKMDFISLYAGNVNGAGKRKFSDDALNEIRDAFSALMYSTLLEEGMPKAYEVISGFNDTAQVIVDMIVDMGVTNSDANVSKIKSSAGDVCSEVKGFLQNLDNY